MDYTNDNNELLLQMFANLRDFNKRTSQRQLDDEQAIVSPALDNTLLHLQAGDGITIKLLAQLLLVTSGAATQQIITLETMQLVQRRSNPSDRRETFVSLTSAGEQVKQQIQTLQVAQAQRLLSGLDDNEIATFAALVNKITTNKEG